MLDKEEFKSLVAGLVFSDVDVSIGRNKRYVDAVNVPNDRKDYGLVKLFQMKCGMWHQFVKDNSGPHRSANLNVDVCLTIVAVLASLQDSKPRAFDYCDELCMARSRNDGLFVDRRLVRNTPHLELVIDCFTMSAQDCNTQRIYCNFVLMMVWVCDAGRHSTLSILA